ncbi:signal-regulatory protein beta-2-like [Erythrolamprus reginae]|uniref:signal-regulatory protein beta-2-like n=1 Tax=Erythrolamprus reginae TaxID=121349 RepID=UPI00396CB2C3
MKWLLGKSHLPRHLNALNETDEKDGRITRNSPDSNTDFSISIRNVTLEDEGTYYCVKESPGSTDQIVALSTRVVVIGIEDKDPWLSQPQLSVSVRIGDVLHLQCEVHNTLQPGAVKWFLGEGPQWKLTYTDAEIGEQDGRITRDSPGSNTDFSISICNVTPEDEGNYYCVKEKKELGRSMDWLKGPGTRVVVRGSQGRSIYGLYLGLFLNKVAMALLLFGLFQMKQHGGCLAGYCTKTRPV